MNISIWLCEHLFDESFNKKQNMHEMYSVNIRGHLKCFFYDEKRAIDAKWDVIANGCFRENIWLSNSIHAKPVRWICPFRRRTRNRHIFLFLKFGLIVFAFFNYFLRLFKYTSVFESLRFNYYFCTRVDWPINTIADLCTFKWRMFKLNKSTPNA